jgi:hypothetical protein
MTTAYTNIGGEGDRRSWLVVSTTATISGGGSVANLIDGTLANNIYFANGQSGVNLVFDFGSGNSPLIDEFTWYQDSAHTQGTWSFRGSHDNSTWTDILTGINLGNASATDVHALTNSTGYRYYGLFQTGGTTSSSPYTKGINFKISGITEGTGATVWSRYSQQATSGVPGLTLSGGGLTVASTGAGGADIATFNATTGKFYYEWSCTGMDDNNSGVGVADITLVKDFAGGKGNTASGVLLSTGEIYANGTGIVGGLNPYIGHVICIAVDVGAQIFWARIDGGNWNASGTANPATGAGGISFSYMNASNPVAPAFVASDAAFSGTANFGATSYAQTPPTGFGNWATPGVTGTWASTEAADIFASVGWSVTAGITANLSTHEAPDTFAATGYPLLSGTMLLTEAQDIFSGYIIFPVAGTLTATEAKDQFSALATTPGVGGNWTSIDPVDVVNVIGYTPISGTFAPVEASDIFQALGSGASATVLRRVFFVC